MSNIFIRAFILKVTGSRNFVGVSFGRAGLTSPYVPVTSPNDAEVEVTVENVN